MPIVSVPPVEQMLSDEQVEEPGNTGNERAGIPSWFCLTSNTGLWVLHHVVFWKANILYSSCNCWCTGNGWVIESFGLVIKARHELTLPGLYEWAIV